MPKSRDDNLMGLTGIKALKGTMGNVSMPAQIHTLAATEVVWH